MSNNILPLRDNLLVTMACRAAYMDNNGVICLPSGSYGEDMIAEFVSEMVDRYIELSSSENDISFDGYIETSLITRFGSFKVNYEDRRLRNEY